MNIYCFDIEANGLVNLELDNKGRAAKRADTIHCIVVTDVTTGEVYPFRPHEITDAVERLKLADVIIGHNIVGYDLPAMRKLAGWSPTKDQKIVDTLIVGRLMPLQKPVLTTVFRFHLILVMKSRALVIK